MKHTIKLFSLLFCFCLVTSLTAQDKQQEKVVVITKVNDQEESASHHTIVRVFKSDCQKNNATAGQPGEVRVDVEMEDGNKHITIVHIDAEGEEHEIEWEGTGEPPAYIQQYLHQPPAPPAPPTPPTAPTPPMPPAPPAPPAFPAPPAPPAPPANAHHNVKERIFIIVTTNEEQEVEDDSSIPLGMTDETEEVEALPALPATLQKGEPLILSSLEFYPVPTSGKLQLRFSTEEMAPVQINVMDVQGRSVYQEDVKTGMGDYRNEIDLTDNPPGTYFLSIRQGDKLHTERIVIQR